MLPHSFQVWAEKDPAAAAAYFRSLPPGELKASGIVKAWAAKDPEAALRWAGQANTFERADLIGTAVASVAGSDVGMAAALISQMEDGVLRDTATASLTTAWVAKDPTAALSWAAALPAGPARDKALADSSSIWAGSDSAAAAAWAAKAPEGSLPLKAYSAIMGVVRRDPAAAYAWINELPEGPAGHAIKNMFSFPRESQVDAVLALTEGKNKARIVEQASTKFFQTGPDQALAWALSLPDVKQRQQMRQFVEAIEPTDQPSFWNQMTLEKKAELLQRLK